MTQQKKPNVVFMLVDNIGWDDLGCYGGMAPTPRLDHLANEGMCFQNYAETFDGPVIKPQFPLAFDLIDDPDEQINLTSKRMDMMWMYGPVIQRMIALEKSYAQYPNIQPGQNFDGYENS